MQSTFGIAWVFSLADLGTLNLYIGVDKLFSLTEKLLNRRTQISKRSNKKTCGTQRPRCSPFSCGKRNEDNPLSPHYQIELPPSLKRKKQKRVCRWRLSLSHISSLCGRKQNKKNVREGASGASLLFLLPGHTTSFFFQGCC